MKRLILYTLTSMALLLSSTALGQQWEFGANFGGTGYMGDINPSNPFYYNNLGGGLHVKYNFDPTWGVRVQGNYLRIHGHDGDSNNAFQQNRGLSFSNDIWEMAALGEFHFFRFVPNYDKYSFTPYLYAGVAAIHHNPYDPNNPDTPESTKNWGISIPYGFGLKYNLQGPWTIGVETGYRTALTNKLDNVDDKLRGSGGKYDGYMTAGLTITYSIVSSRCYWW